jgi:signal recognition particle GTPase
MVAGDAVQNFGNSSASTITLEGDTAEVAIERAFELLRAGFTDIVIIDPAGRTHVPEVLMEVYRKCVDGDV